jgi:hypothetical protein
MLAAPCPKVLAVRRAGIEQTPAVADIHRTGKDAGKSDERRSLEAGIGIDERPRQHDRNVGNQATFCNYSKQPVFLFCSPPSPNALTTRASQAVAVMKMATIANRQLPASPCSSLPCPSRTNH